MTWRVIPSFPNYEITCDVYQCGAIRRLHPANGTTVGKLLKFKIRQGYLSVGLWRDGKQYWRLVHGLMAETYLGPRPIGLQINHKDLYKGNNHPSNLEYVSAKDNIHHAMTYGVLPRGEDVLTAKLDWAKVNIIRTLYEDGDTLSSLAKQFGVGKSCIGRVIHYESWSGRQAV